MSFWAKYAPLLMNLFLVAWLYHFHVAWLYHFHVACDYTFPCCMTISFPRCMTIIISMLHDYYHFNVAWLYHFHVAWSNTHLANCRMSNTWGLCVDHPALLFYTHLHERHFAIQWMQIYAKSLKIHTGKPSWLSKWHSWKCEDKEGILIPRPLTAMHKLNNSKGWSEELSEDSMTRKGTGTCL